MCVTITREQEFVILQRQKKRKYNDGFKPTHDIKVIREINSTEKPNGDYNIQQKLKRK